MDNIFLVIKLLGIVLALVALATMLYHTRPIFREARRRYDRRMRRTVKILILAAVLIVVGVIGQFLQ